MAKRRFGMLRKLPSGRYQASFINPAGARQNAPDTFKTKTDANRWLTLIEADISRGVWLDDRAAAQTLGNFARAVLRDSPKIGVRWRETCERNMRLHLAPLLDTPLRALSPTLVREWHAAALRGKGGRTSISQSYRFLRMVMNVAVREGLIARSPCQLPGAGVAQASERPVATPAEVVALVEAITPRYRTAVLIAAWCGLRRGEIAGLRVSDVDLIVERASTFQGLPGSPYGEDRCFAGADGWSWAAGFVRFGLAPLRSVGLPVSGATGERECARTWQGAQRPVSA